MSDLSAHPHSGEMHPIRTSLVVGGTGMLAEATGWLVGQSETTVLVARHASAFEGADGLKPVEVSWNDDTFVDEVARALAGLSPVEAALLWLHEPDQLLASLLGLLPSARVVLILGSMDGCPKVPDVAANVAFVRLGSVSTGSGRRWLTHDEISAGAIAALQDGQGRIIGALSPAN